MCTATPDEDGTVPGRPGDGAPRLPDPTPPTSPDVTFVVGHAEVDGTHSPHPVSAQASPSARFGSYALLRELGRGGQGVVYEANDLRLGRRVALKLLTGAYAADAWTRLRFEREAAAAARLDHPGICTVYEAGAVDGVPFIAMRLVAGRTVADRIREARETTATAGTTSTGTSQRRQSVFAEVEIVENAARALHVAHEAGLVHRDIKPGNLMLEKSGQPVILDFGLARDAQSTDASLTGTGTFVGTPAYMSPEQAAGATEIDRRTDVWSMGVTLYEMTSLRRPFEGATLEALLRAIRTTEPEDPRRLNPAITPELSAVILTALDKNPARRYQDAAAFAEDLRRARSFEPVRARPATVAVRLQRWTQRNPAIAASLCVAFLALAAGLIVSLHSLSRTQEALAGETAALGEARRIRGNAEDLISFMLVDLKSRLTEVGKLELLAKVARKAGDYYADRPLDLDDVPDALRRSLLLRNLGEVVAAEGDSAEATRKFDESASILQTLVERRPDDVAAMRELASTLNAIAGAQMIRGENAAAVATTEKSLTIRRRLLEIDPREPEHARLLAAGLTMYGNTLKAARRNEEALVQYREAAERWRTLSATDSRPQWRRELGITLQNLGESLRVNGDPPAAIRARREGLSIFQALTEAEPENREWAELLATGSHGLALALRESDQPAEALKSSEQAVAVLRRLLFEDPVNSRRLYQMGHALNVLGVLQEQSGKRDEAFRSFQEVCEFRERLGRLDPRNTAWRLDRALSQRTVARVQGERGDVAAALETLAAPIEALRRLCAEVPKSAAFATRLGWVLADAAECARELGRVDEAERHAEGALAAHGAAAQLAPADANAAADAATATRDLARAAHEAGHFDQASALLARAVEERRRAASIEPEARRLGAIARVGFALSLQGSEEMEMGHLAAAEIALRAAVQELTGLEEAPSTPKDAIQEIHAECLRARIQLAHCLWRADRLDEATPLAADAAADRNASDAAIKKFTSDGRIDALVEVLARTRALAKESPASATDHAIVAMRAAVGERPAESLPHFKVVLDRDGAEEPRLPVTLRAFFHAGSIAASRVLAAGSKPDQDAALVGERCVAMEVSILRAAIRDMEKTLVDRRAAGSDTDVVREKLRDLRCAVESIRTFDPQLAPLRARPGFARLFEAP